MERSHQPSGRSATPADINRNGRPTSIGTGGRHQSECPADIVGIRNGPREGKGKSDLCRCDGILPLRRRFGSEDPQRWSEDEVALKVERVMDGSVHIQKALGGSS